MKELDRLNPEQRRAVLHSGKPLLILAGAGSGKTRVITTKIAYLVCQGVDPQSILAVTFTNKAADEMRSRALKITTACERVMIRTFHSFGAWLLRRNSHLINLASHFSIYDQDDSLALLKRTVGDRIKRDDLRRYLNWISRAKDNNLRPMDNLDPICKEDDFAKIYELYQKKLISTGNVDFGDLIIRSVELLSQNPEVKKRIQQRFRVIMVDEYQDANTAQFLLLRELYHEQNYLCVVGDEDQSIYRFRGADVRNILDFSQVFTGTEIIRLEQNYRSTKNILEAAISVVTNNTSRLGKELWTKRESGAPITLAYLNNDNEEALFCAHLLEDEMYDETAILYRNNSQSRIFETVLARFNIPFRLVGTLRFAEREEVKDALAYLALLLNPRDEVSFLRICNKPSRGLGRISLKKIGSIGQDNFLAAGRRSLKTLSKRAAAGLSNFLSIMENLEKRLASDTVSELLKRLIHDSGLYEYYTEKDKSDGTKRILNLEELVNAALPFGSGTASLSDFLESLTLNSSDENPFACDGRVSLITIHNTKGLEFDRIIITGLEDGLFPHYRDPYDQKDLEAEEERRLFYVAMTRARDHLYLTSCRLRRIFGISKVCQPSRFLSEIPANLLEFFPEAYNHTIRENSDNGDMDAGSSVYHYDYGSGIIEKRWHDGEYDKVIVRFQTGRSAEFILKYSGLEKVAPDD